MVALLERLLSEPLPAFWAVDRLRSFHCNIEIAAFNSQLKSGVGILHEVQCNLSRKINCGKKSRAYIWILPQGILSVANTR
jgi:hypothetical protein